jgi:heme oxygenase
MENLSIKIKRTQEVETEISIPNYFKVNSYWYCKMITPSAFTIVNYYTDKIENITALELWPSIKVEHIRYLSWVVKGDNLEEITEEEFNLHLNAAKKLIWSL